MCQYGNWPRPGFRALGSSCCNEGRNMKFLRREFLRLAGGVAAVAALPRRAAAADYPARPVRIVAGFTAGGGVDITARLIGQWLGEHLGQSFIIENRPGAGGNIGTEAVVNAAPDGYTLLLVTGSNVINSALYDKLNFNFLRDIVPVGSIVRLPLLMIVHPSVPARTVPEFIAYAKANPGKISMASVGNGTTPHLAGELFKMMAGVDLLHVPYRGAAPALTDLLAGRAQVMFEAMSTLVAYIKDDKLRALAVTLPQRSPIFPDVPSVGEFLPGYEAAVWFGIGAPKKPPTAIVELLNKEINAGLADPTTNTRLNDLGGAVLKGPPSEFEKHFVGDTEKWAKVIKTANIKPEEAVSFLPAQKQKSRPCARRNQNPAH